jgi:hypothetical protein
LRGLSAVDELPQRAADTRQTLPLGEGPGVTPGHDHDVGPGGQTVAVEGEGLAEQPLDLVSLYGPADLA